MAFKKGQSGNRAGRPVGSKNRATTDLRKSIQQFIDTNWKDVQATFNKLEPKDKLQFLDRLLAYSLPKLQATTLSASIEGMTEEELDRVIDEIKEAMI